MSSPLMTPDGRYIVVRGRLWRAANPNLDAQQRATLTERLMTARRAVGSAMRRRDRAAEREARRAVDLTKRALGERGPVWWSDGAPDYNRRLVKNTPYSEWFDATQQWETAILAMLAERDHGASVCPSEIARRLAPDHWRSCMDEVRSAARRLAARGEVRISRRGEVLAADEEFRGPIRIRLA